MGCCFMPPVDSYNSVFVKVYHVFIYDPQGRDIPAKCLPQKEKLAINSNCLLAISGEGRDRK